MSILDNHSESSYQCSPATDVSTFQLFKKELEEHRLLDKPSDMQVDEMPYGIDDDSTLGRFLTARKCNIGDAITHFKNAHSVRQLNSLSKSYDDIDVDLYEETRDLYPHWTGRLCRKGQPICTLDSLKLNQKALADFRESSANMKFPTPVYSEEGALSMEVLRSVINFEYLTRFVIPLCSAVNGDPEGTNAVSKIILLVDISGISMSQIWYLKDYLQNLSQILAKLFPEILDRVFITQAPRAFSIIWNMIKNWADPGTVSKIVFLNPDEVSQTLQSLITIENLPRKYGGTLDYEHGMQPLLDDRIKRFLRWPSKSLERLPQGPLKWIVNSAGEEEAIAVGTINGETRVEHVATVPKSI